MQDIVVYSLKQTMESVLESLVSKYESYFTHNRNMNEEKTNVDFINKRHLIIFNLFSKIFHYETITGWPQTFGGHFPGFSRFFQVEKCHFPGFFSASIGRFPGFPGF